MPRPALLFGALLLLLSLLPLRATEVLLTADDLVPFGGQPGGHWIAPELTLPAPDTALPLLGPRAPKDAVTLLQSLHGRGMANGFVGILYDNRDRAHSPLSAEAFPRLARLTYGPALTEQNADYGLAGAILLPAIVFGNSSTAVSSGPIARSLPRLAMTTPGGAQASARLYRNNALYVYPEHRDHDAADLFPANWPHMLVSQGSSHSDRVFLEALAVTLAAFRPDTLDALRRHRLVAPTLQMILRRNLASVVRADDYFTGPAQSLVLDGSLLRPGRMVGHAAALTPETIPPMVRIEVVNESFTDAAGLAGLSERLFDTPQAVARVWRGFGYEHEMVVSAARTVDPNGRPLTFSWHLLQGDPDRVEITPIGPDGAQARLRIRWHDPWEVAATREGQPGTRQLSRVDIAVFADNGTQPSAPAIVSVSFPAHQARTYAETPSATALPRLTRVDYDAAARAAPYDPLLHWTAPWADTALYAADGTLTGWARARSDGTPPRDVPLTPLPYPLDRTDLARPTLTEPPA